MSGTKGAAMAGAVVGVLVTALLGLVGLGFGAAGAEISGAGHQFTQIWLPVAALVFVGYLVLTAVLLKGRYFNAAVGIAWFPPFLILGVPALLTTLSMRSVAPETLLTMICFVGLGLFIRSRRRRREPDFADTLARSNRGELRQTLAALGGRRALAGRDWHRRQPGRLAAVARDEGRRPGVSGSL
jgi:hypothetical protein